LHRYAWGIIKPAFKEENPGFSDVDLGWLDSAFLATYAFGQIPGGMAGDRFGPRATLALFTLVWSLAVGGVGWTSGFWRLIGARAAFGLAQAGAYPIVNKMTRIWFPLSIRTTVQGLVTAMGRIGGACAPVIVATFLMGMLGLSWQAALVTISVPGLILAIAFWLAVRNRPSEHPWTNQAEQELLDDSLPPPSGRGAGGEGEASIAAGDPPYRSVGNDRHPPVWHLTGASMFSVVMCCCYIFVSTFQDQFYVNWLPLFLREGKHAGLGLDVGTMGLFAPLPLLGGAAGGILGGILNDWLIRRTGNRRWSRSGVAFTGKFIAAGMVIASIHLDDGRLTMLVLVAARVFSDWSLPTQWATITDMGGRKAATLFGIVNTIGAAGGFVAGPVFGWLKEQWQWDGVFYGVAGMCVLAAATWMFIDCTKRVVAD
jgi:ACS family glucarate transporter-like MFS transporter/ACS family D-galactonate transporter-like MFS transporter